MITASLSLLMLFQIFPTNSVGYFNASYPPGFSLIAVQLETRTTIQTILRQPVGINLFKFEQGSFTTNHLSELGWTFPEQTLGPGEGAFLFNPGPGSLDFTVVGEVLQGKLTNTLPAGLSLKSSIVPQDGFVTRDLGLKLNAFDNIYIWTNNIFHVYTVLPDGSWFPAEPRVAKNQSFFLNLNTATNWVRNFQLNP